MEKPLILTAQPVRTERPAGRRTVWRGSWTDLTRSAAQKLLEEGRVDRRGKAPGEKRPA